MACIYDGYWWRHPDLPDNNYFYKEECEAKKPVDSGNSMGAFDLGINEKEIDLTWINPNIPKIPANRVLKAVIAILLLIIIYKIIQSGRK